MAQIQNLGIPAGTASSPYALKKSITTAGTPLDVDVNAQLGKNGHHGLIKAFSTNTGVMKVKFSANGSDYTANYVEDMEAGDVLDLEGMDIDTLRIDSSVNGESVMILVW